LFGRWCVLPCLLRDANHHFDCRFATSGIKPMEEDRGEFVGRDDALYIGPPADHCCLTKPASQAQPLPRHCVHRAERRSMSLEASAPHRIIQGASAVGERCWQGLVVALS
jgi:hypothetical protein